MRVRLKPMDSIHPQTIIGVLQKTKRSLHLMEILLLLNLNRQEKRALSDALHALVQDRQLREMPGNRYALPKATPLQAKPQTKPNPRSETTKKTARKSSTERRQPPQHEITLQDKNIVQGWSKQTPKGIVVVAEDGGSDVWVTLSDFFPALPNDRVAIRVESDDSDRRRGALVRILQHGNKRLIGQLISKTELQPLDLKDFVQGSIQVNGELPLDVSVGDHVVAEWVQFPLGKLELLKKEVWPSVRVLTAMPKPSTAQYYIDRLKIREGIEEAFDAAVLEESALMSPPQLGPSPTAQQLDGRVDIRDLPLCTIDPHDAKDHDDAVYVEQTSKGFRAVIAIADVSYYVPEGGATDKVAFERATSIYLPDRAIPMLPHEISSNRASLVPDEDRYVMVVDAELNREGRVLGKKIYEGVMRSHARFSYEDLAMAMGWIEGKSSHPLITSFLPNLKSLSACAEKLLALRHKRGAIELDIAESKVVINKQTREPIASQKERKDPGIKKAYSAIEEMMLLANELVAQFLDEKKLPGVYRVHGSPDSKKLHQFAEACDAFGLMVDPESLSHPKGIQKFLESIKDHPRQGPLNQLLLRTLAQAKYTTENEGHFALALFNYLHFTSPIRRYPDLLVHRSVKRHLRHNPYQKSIRKDWFIASLQSSRMERRAMTVERSAKQIYQTVLMRNRIGECFDAMITGLTEQTLFASIHDPFVEIRISIENTRTEVSPTKTHLLTGGMTLALGDEIRVRIKDVSLERGEILAEFEHLKLASFRGAREASRTRRRSDVGRSTSRARSQAQNSRKSRERSSR